jgi:hypothetical protein
LLHFSLFAPQPDLHTDNLNPPHPVVKNKEYYSLSSHGEY